MPDLIVAFVGVVLFGIVIAAVIKHYTSKGKVPPNPGGPDSYA